MPFDASFTTIQTAPRSKFTTLHWSQWRCIYLVRNQIPYVTYLLNDLFVSYFINFMEICFPSHLADTPIYDIVTLNVRNMLACKMSSLVNKSVDWPPNYHKHARISPKSSVPPHSITKLTLDKPATRKYFPGFKLVPWLAEWICSLHFQGEGGGSVNVSPKDNLCASVVTSRWEPRWTNPSGFYFYATFLASM